MNSSHTMPARICSVERSHIADLIRIGHDTGLSPWSAESYIAEMQNADAIMLRLVSDDHETMGFVVGRIIAGGSVDVVAEAEIYNIAVVDGHRRRGNGQKLLDSFISAASERGARSVWLEVRESNTGATAFYRRNGFEHVQTRPNFYSDPMEAALLMRRILAIERG